MLAERVSESKHLENTKPLDAIESETQGQTKPREESRGNLTGAGCRFIRRVITSGRTVEAGLLSFIPFQQIIQRLSRTHLSALIRHGNR